MPFERQYGTPLRAGNGDLATSLVGQIQRVQAEHNLSVREFAARLGIHSNFLYQIYLGKKEPGVKFFKGIGREFPELLPWVNLYLQGFLVLLQGENGQAVT